jgi:hypothetical protein
LLDLAAEKDFAHEFKEEFSSRGYSLLVPPTVIAELAFSFLALTANHVASKPPPSAEKRGYLEKYLTLFFAFFLFCGIVFVASP